MRLATSSLLILLSGRQHNPLAHAPDDHDDEDPTHSSWHLRTETCVEPISGGCTGSSLDLPEAECIAWKTFFCGLEGWEESTRHYHNTSLMAARSCDGLGMDPCACRYPDADGHLRGVSCTSDPSAMEPTAHITQLDFANAMLTGEVASNLALKMPKLRFIELGGNRLEETIIYFNPYDNPAHKSVLHELQYTSGIAIYKPENLTYSFENKSDPFAAFVSNIVYVNTNDSAIVSAKIRETNDDVGVATGVHSMLTAEELMQMLLLTTNLVYLCAAAPDPVVTPVYFDAEPVEPVILPSPCSWKLQFTGPCYNGNEECFSVRGYAGNDEDDGVDGNAGVQLWSWEPQEMRLAFLRGDDLWKETEFEEGQATLVQLDDVLEAIRNYEIPRHKILSP
jgi:hypothetical protein